MRRLLDVRAEKLSERHQVVLDVRALHAKVNYYAPALTALTLASPLSQGELWTIRGRVGKSIRTYRRSVLAPAIEIQNFRPFDMRGINVYEAPKDQTPYTGFKISWGAGFTQQFQGLGHSNAAAAKVTKLLAPRSR